MRSALKHIESMSLREQALSAIRGGIVLGEIEPGSVYSVPSLATKLGVSATPVREAMLDLVKEGLVEPVRNKGFRVISLTEKDLDEIFQLRLLLEVPAVGQIAGVLSEATLRSLEALVETMEVAANTGDLTKYLETDRRFHLMLLAQVGNERLVEIVDRLREHTRLYGLTGLVADGQLAETTAEHRRILEALEKGDRNQAEELMRIHLRHTRGVWAGVQEEHAAAVADAEA